MCQIFQRQVSVSYARMSDNATLSGLSLLGTNPITDPVEHQKMRNLEQIAVDVEYTMLNGVYQKAAAAVSGGAAEKSNKMRGIITALTTNVVAAGGALTKAHIKTLVASMADHGAPFKNAVLFGNSTVKQAITDLFGTTPLGAVPQSRNVGGLNIETIVTDFGEIGVVYDRYVPAGTLLIADLAFVTPVSLAVPGKGHMFYEPLSKTGAGESGQYYGQIGLAYGPEVYHGKIVSIMAFGAFVEIIPNKDGLLHISEIDWKRYETMEETGLKEGDEIDVKLVEIDQKTGKLRLSHRALLPKPEGYEEEKRGGNGGGRGNGGNRGGHGGGNRNGGGHGNGGGRRR